MKTFSLTETLTEAANKLDPVKVTAAEKAALPLEKGAHVLGSYHRNEARRHDTLAHYNKKAAGRIMRKHGKYKEKDALPYVPTEGAEGLAHRKHVMLGNMHIKIAAAHRELADHYNTVNDIQKLKGK
jgi:hypothetical protein